VDDKDFKKQMNIMLRRVYNQNWKLFQCHVVEYKDFVQEMWCRLFEEKTYNGDVKLSMTSIKHNSMDYVRDMRRRLQIVAFQPYESTAYYAIGGEYDKF
jgi:hypothetical protein